MAIFSAAEYFLCIGLIEFYVFILIGQAGLLDAHSTPVDQIWCGLLIKPEFVGW